MLQPHRLKEEVEIVQMVSDPYTQKATEQVLAVVPCSVTAGNSGEERLEREIKVWLWNPGIELEQLRLRWRGHLYDVREVEDLQSEAIVVKAVKGKRK